MRHYETIYIVNPNLSEEEYRDLLKRGTVLIDDSDFKEMIARTEGSNLPVTSFHSLVADL